jgi:hypothetical protein
MCISVFGKRLSRKSNNVVVFPFAFHIVVQQPFKPLWSCLLLYDLEPSEASFALRFKSLLMTLLPASEEFLSKYPSSSYLFSSGCYPLDLSGVGDPAGSNATADLALRVTRTHKPLQRNKVVIPSGGGGGGKDIQYLIAYCEVLKDSTHTVQIEVLTESAQAIEGEILTVFGQTVQG